MVADDVDFCSTCENLIEKQCARWDAEIEFALGLEAEFVVWCADNGQPHPHV